MRWLRYTLSDVTCFGILDENDHITPVAGSPFGAWTRQPQRLRLEDVTLEVPVIPPTFYCVGRNYMAHINSRGAEIPSQPDAGYRANNALLAHGREVRMPADATCVHYEGELVVVIGKKVRNISPDEVAQCIFGYTIGNDVTERNWRKSDRTFWRCKNTDTFKPMGPWISTVAELASMQTTVRVNGVETTRFATAAMLFDVATFISTMSRYLTLYPGDILWMGTDGESPDLQHGDEVEISLTGLGTLRNRFVLDT